MTLHTLNVKGLEQPHRQPQRQTTPTQTTRKGWGGGADGRRSAATPTVKAAPFAAPRTGPVTTCERHSVAQSDCAASRQPGLAKFEGDHQAGKKTTLLIDMLLRAAYLSYLPRTGVWSLPGRTSRGHIATAARGGREAQGIKRT